MNCVLIYSKNSLFRECLAKVVSELKIANSVACVNSGEMLNSFLAANRPEYVIADLYSRNYDEDIIPMICNAIDKNKLILVTTHENIHLNYYYTEYNVNHFIFAEDSVEEITDSVRCALSGLNGCSFIKRDTLLTPRECEILRLIATGKTSKEIADMLCISKNTVDTHRNKMLQKLNMANSASLVQYAYSSGLI